MEESQIISAAAAADKRPRRPQSRRGLRNRHEPQGLSGVVALFQRAAAGSVRRL